MVSCSLVDRGCWTFVACGVCVRGNARSSCLESAGTGWLAELLYLCVGHRQVRGSSMQENLIEVVCKSVQDKEARHDSKL